MIGEVIGSYRVLSELGRGGMGVVMRAEHLHLRRPAAIKFLQRNLCDNAEAVQRFLVEARATAEIQHPGIVHIYDCGICDDGSAFIVMELLEGETLQSALFRRGNWPYGEVAATVVQIIDALLAAHRAGVVHRDLKPENIFLLSRKPGRVKLVDFGIAKLAERDYGVKTVSGAVIGTPRYMSPEQARGSLDVDYRSDIYSLGCVLFEMLTGRAAYPQESAGELIACHQLAPVPNPLEVAPHLPTVLAEITVSMLAKDRAHRPSLEDVRGVLESFVSAGAVSRRTEVLQSEPMATRILSGGSSGAPPWGSSGASISSGTGPQATTGRQRPTAVLPGEPSIPPTAQSGPIRLNDDTDLVRPRRGRDLLLVAAGVLVMGGVVAAFTLGAPKNNRHAPVAKPELAPIPAPIPALVPAPAPAPAPSAPPQEPKPLEPVAAKPIEQAPPAHEPAQPTYVKVTLTSDPSGAIVCSESESKRLGVTGSALTLRRSARKQALLIYKPGYRVQTVTITPDKDQSRAFKMRPLSADDLRELPPCN